MKFNHVIDAFFDTIDMKIFGFEHVEFRNEGRPQKLFYSGTLLLLVFFVSVSNAQTNYNSMTNWAFHPNKTGTLIDGFNLNIAVVNENLTTTSVIPIANNSMVNTGVDVFYIHPTILENLASYTKIENIQLIHPLFRLSYSGLIGNHLECQIFQSQPLCRIQRNLLAFITKYE